MESEKDNSSRGGRSEAMYGLLGFTLVELLVVISVIALLMAIFGPALSAAKRMATGAVCLGNQRALITAWMLYSEDHDGNLIGNLACYDSTGDKTPWVFSPKDAFGGDLPSHPAPVTITDEDRFRGIRQGTLWRYTKDLGVYHCPGDDRRSRRQPPRDCYRSYSISYAFGHRSGHASRSGYSYITRMQDIRNPPQYYVFVEEEGSGAIYGENDGAWRLPVGKVSLPSGVVDVRISDPSSWMFHDSLASFHNESGTFGFADGHAERHTWTDTRTLESIRLTYQNPYPLYRERRYSPGNEDIRWLIEHFIEATRIH